MLNTEGCSKPCAINFNSLPRHWGEQASRLARLICEKSVPLTSGEDPAVKLNRTVYNSMICFGQ